MMGCADASLKKAIVVWGGEVMVRPPAAAVWGMLMEDVVAEPEAEPDAEPDAEPESEPEFEVAAEPEAEPELEAEPDWEPDCVPVAAAALVRGDEDMMAAAKVGLWWTGDGRWDGGGRGGGRGGERRGRRRRRRPA